MKASGQKLTRHKRLHRRFNRRKNKSLDTSWSEKRQKRSGFAEALKDGELHLFKRRQETYFERISRLAMEDKHSFRDYWEDKTAKGEGASPIPTETEVKHIEEDLVQNKAHAQKKSFFQNFRTGVRKIFQRKVG